MDNPTNNDIIAITRQWVETIVIELNLCPFAKRALSDGAVEFIVSDAASEIQLLEDLQRQLLLLKDRLARPDQQHDTTTLLIHPNVLTDFADYNQFLDLADALLTEVEMEGIYQIASFHPHYQFAGTHLEDAENYSNKSPYPMLHLLPEAQVELALTHYPDPEQIPQRNMALLADLGEEALQARLDACFKAHDAGDTP